MARQQARKGRAASSMADGPIRILHLSDFHLSAERRWDSDPVLAGLAEIIGGLTGKGLGPDVVAITGDIADKGRPKDYEEARRWIDKGLRPALPPRFPDSRILIVPGNHDVDRSKVGRSARALQSDLVDSADQDAVAEVLGDEGERGILLKRHEAYLDFANDSRAGKEKLITPW
ncbi:MAG: metallophosphoesterase, partial [Planctomycetes bacterium]|nr:metallophosphoesterase [Planctomycetota bacterium]